MAVATNNSDVFRTATAYEASKESRLVKPDEAERVRSQGRAQFYNALMGRYGLPGSVVARLEDTPVADTAAGQRYDLSDMTVTNVMALAQELTGGLAQQSYLGQAAGLTSTQSLIAEYEDWVEMLTDEGADQRAIDGAKNVLEQARLMQAEQALFRSLDAARDDREDGSFFGLGGFLNAGIGGGDPSALGPFGAPTDLLSLPPAAVTLMLTDSGR